MEQIQFRLGVIIPSHNRKLYLGYLLQQLQYQLEIAIPGKYYIIVILDGCSDGSYEMIYNNYQKIQIIEGSGDWWYTRSINEGLKKADNLSVTHVLLLNDDVILANNFVESLLADYNKLQDDPILGAVSFSVSEPTKITGGGIKDIIWWQMKLKPYYKFMSHIELKNFVGVHPSVVLPGRGMYTSMKNFKRLNYFDQIFAQYGSDYDFCLRARKIGIKSFVSFETRLFSYVELTSPSSSFKNKSFIEFLRSFVNCYSRNYLVSRAIYLWRHGIKVLWPLTFMLFLLGAVKANMFRKRLND